MHKKITRGKKVMPEVKVPELAETITEIERKPCRERVSNRVKN